MITLAHSRKGRRGYAGPALLVAVLGAAAGCQAGEEPGGPGTLGIAMTAAASGDGQQWSTGHTLPNPLRVIVTRGGMPAPGVEVRWAGVGGAGAVTPEFDTTGPDGIAITRFTLGTVARGYQVEASVDGAEGSPVVFSATAYPNFAHQLSLAGGDGQSGPVDGTLSEPLTVLVGDQFNNPFAGQAVEWEVLSGPATVAPTVSVSNAAGLAATEVRPGPAPGAVTVRASFAGATGGPEVLFQVTVTP